MAVVNYFANISYLMLETNSDCNLSCTFCNRDDIVNQGRRKKEHISEERFITILEKFKNCPVETIKLQGISEPTLHPKFPKLTQILRKYFPNAFVIIATNMQTDFCKIDWSTIIENVDVIYLSLSATEDLYAKHHVGGSWKRIIDNLNHLKKIIPKETRRKKLFINFTATNSNYKTLPKIYSLNKEYVLANVRINLAQNWNEDEKNTQDFSHECLEFLKQYKQDVLGVGGWNYRDCFWPFNGVVIDVYGDIRQCVLNTTQEPIANIFADDIEQVYNFSRHYTQTRANLQNNVPTKSCLNCDYKFLSPILYKFFNESTQNNKARSFEKPITSINPFPITVSGSSFEIIPATKNEPVKLRKSHSSDFERIEREFLWLNKFSHLKSVPTPLDFYKDEKVASYQRPYYYDYQDLALASKSYSKANLESIIRKVIETISFIHGSAPKQNVSFEQASQYIENKFFEKISLLLDHSPEIARLSTFEHVEINNVSYLGLEEIKKHIRSPQIMDLLKQDFHSSLHGDLTAENILIGPRNQIILIDPNDNNIISSPLIDFAKLNQSFKYCYEYLSKVNDLTVSENSISYNVPHHKSYDIAAQEINKYISDNFSKAQQKLILLHEAINFSRLLPYQVPLRPKLVPVYFSKMIQIFNQLFNEIA